MLKQITLTGSLVTMALLSACGSPPPARLSLSERLPIAVDLVRQPNGEPRPTSEVIRAEAACELRAVQARQNAASLVLTGAALGVVVRGAGDAIDDA